MGRVIVTCGDETRSVFIDNQNQGSTGTALSVPEGMHVFDLGQPPDYTPPFQQVAVGPTPMQIAFTPMDAMADVEAVSAPFASRARTLARARKRVARKRP